MAQINKPSDYFNTVLYTGTGATLSITGVGFQPDFVWTKGRSVAYSHYLMDSVRGVGRRIMSNSTSNEDINIFGVSSFDSDGFTLGTDTGANNNGSTFASWNWLASNTTASNTDGSIASTVSANTTAGFSIVTYTGTGATATFGHGLGASPSMVIIKDRTNGTKNWTCYHQAMGNDRSIFLNLTDAQTVPTDHWQYTTPSNSVVYIGDYSHINTNTDDYIAYCFAEKKGFSKFGSYTGNGSTDGTFAYTGFKPAFVLLKNADDGTRSWYTFDNKRNTFNATNSWLAPNLSNAEGSLTSGVDFLSNGFKVRESTTAFNGSGNTFIYMAFAENPLVGTNNIPTTAR